MSTGFAGRIRIDDVGCSGGPGEIGPRGRHLGIPVLTMGRPMPESLKLYHSTVQIPLHLGKVGGCSVILIQDAGIAINDECPFEFAPDQDGDMDTWVGLEGHVDF